MFDLRVEIAVEDDPLGAATLVNRRVSEHQDGLGPSGRTLPFDRKQIDKIMECFVTELQNEQTRVTTKTTKQSRLSPRYTIILRALSNVIYHCDDVPTESLTIVQEKTLSGRSGTETIKYDSKQHKVLRCMSVVVAIRGAMLGADLSWQKSLKDVLSIPAPDLSSAVFDGKVLIAMKGKDPKGITDILSSTLGSIPKPIQTTDKTVDDQK